MNRTSISEKRGLTLVEVLIASAILAVIIAVVITTVVFVTRSGYTMGDYVKINSETRVLSEYFSREIRNATAIQTLNSDEFQFKLKNAANIEYSIQYIYNPNTQELTRNIIDVTGSVTDSDVVLENLESFAFRYFRGDGTEETAGAGPNFIRRIRFEGRSTATNLNKESTADISSATYYLRNAYL